MCGDALRVLHSPLSPEGLGLGCPLTPTSREAFLLTQSAVTAAQLSLEDWADAHRRDARAALEMEAVAARLGRLHAVVGVVAAAVAVLLERGGA